MVLLTACFYQQQSEPVQKELHFPETDLIVSGEFSQFFETYGGVDSLGYPLTREITVDGWRVQYFENGRLEYHPENEPAYRVTVGWLGDLLNRRQPPIPSSAIPPGNVPNQRYFAETGHTLSGDFLIYFDTHGGSDRFGLPISEPFLWHGRLTQDFQSARFYWAVKTDEAVVLESIGQTHFEQVIDAK